MKIRPCKNLKNLNLDYPSCRCSDWFCFYDEKYHDVFQVSPSGSFEERCEIVRHTAISSDMTYEQRFQLQRLRYGV